MRNRIASFAGLAVVVVSMLGGAPRAAAQQVVKLGDGVSLTISGFINASFFWDRNLFAAFGQGQNAEYAIALPTTYPRGKIINDGDVRNTRINFTFTGPTVEATWTPKATLEADFFGAFNGAPPFGDEQPQFRVRFAYVDLTNGHTTLRVGQYWSPMFGETGVSLTHIAFPLGYGAAGDVGWRYPGIFLYQDLSSHVQLQLAAFKGSGPLAPGPAGAANVGTGEASGVPQLEARLNVGKKSAGMAWSGYVVGHVDWKDTTGNGSGTKLTSTGLEVGGSVAPGPFTLHGNLYYGRAIGQQFAFITQQGNVRGWGAWAQAGYDFTPHVGFWLFYGTDQPDAVGYRIDNPGLPPLARQLNHDLDALIRIRSGRYALGFEYFRAVTRWAGAAAAANGVTSADQFAISTLFSL